MMSEKRSCGTCLYTRLDKNGQRLFPCRGIEFNIECGPNHEGWTKQPYIDKDMIIEIVAFMLAATSPANKEIPSFDELESGVRNILEIYACVKK